MRVTNSMMTTNLLANVNKNLQKMSKRQDELATGKRIHTASDDPVLASKILARRTDLAELEQYSKNTRDALGWIEITEKAIEDNGNIMQRIRELTVQAANGTNTADDTRKIKLEVENMRKQLISNANSTFAGRYIFSGFETDKGLLKEDGTFNIDINQYTLDNKPVVKYEIGVGESINVMTSGLDVYGVVEESNIMTSGFSSATSLGVASSKSYVSGPIDLTANHTGTNLDLSIGGTTYNIIEATLDGTGVPLTQADIISAYNSADDGGGNLLGTVADVSFDTSGNLVVEAKVYGNTVMTPQAAGTFFDPLNGGVSYSGTAITEASISGVALGDPTLQLPASDIETLKNDNLTLVVNGVSVDLLPDPLTTINTLNDYVAEMSLQLDNEFGAGTVSMTVDAAGIITFATLGTADGVQASIAVDFPSMKTGFPSGSVEGVGSTKSYLSGNFDLETNHTGENLDLSVGGTVYNIDETNLVGTASNPIDKSDLLDIYRSADDGGGNLLGDVANIYFDGSDNLVIESKSFGNTVMNTQAAGTFLDPLNGGVSYSGIVTVETTISGTALGDPTLQLLPEDIDIIRDNGLSIVVNGNSKEVKPSPSSVINNLNDYVAEMNSQLTNEFGAGKVLMSVDALGVITIETTGTPDSEVPSLSVDFAKVHESQLIADIDELIGYMDSGDHLNIGEMLTVIDSQIGNMLSLRADIGARSNRMDLVTRRIASNNVSFTRMLSDAEDADMSEVIMQLKNAENVYKASLSAGARIIQPSLIDFLR